MSDDVLGDLGLDEVPDKVTDGEWPVTLVDARYVSKDDKEAVTFKYRVDKPGDVMSGEPVDEYLDLKTKSTFIKRKIRDRLNLLDVPLKGISRDELHKVLQSKKGTKLWIKVKNRDEFTNVNEAKLRDASLSGAASSSGSTGGAEKDIDY